METIPSGSGFSLPVCQPLSLTVGSLLMVAKMTVGAPMSHLLRIKASGKEPAPACPANLRASHCPSLNPSTLVARGTECPVGVGPGWGATPRVRGGSAPTQTPDPRGGSSGCPEGNQACLPKEKVSLAAAHPLWPCVPW